MKYTSIRHRSLFCTPAVLCGAFLLTALSVSAVDRNWENTGTDFNTAGNWVENAVPGTGDRGVFNTVGTTNPNLSGSLTIQGLVFGPTSGATTAGSGYTLSSSSGSTALSLTHSGTHDGARAIYQNTTGNNTISAPLIFAATGSGNDQVNLVTGGGSLILTGNLTGVNRVVDFRINNAASTITLAGSNDFAAGFKQSGSAGSIINVSNVNGVNGSGNFSMGHNNSPGTILNNTSGSTISVDYSDFRINSGHATLGGSNWEFLSATMTLTGTRTLNTDTGLVVIGGNVGEDGATGNLIKGRNGSGTGTLELRGASTYTGFTEAQSGVLLLNHADALAAGNLRLAGNQTATETGAVLGLGAGNFTRSLGTGAGQVQWVTGGGVLSAGGFAAYGADRTVNLGGASAQVIWGTGGFAGNRLILGSAGADATVDFQNPIDISGGGGSRTFQANDGSADVDGILSGVISGSQALEKVGDGTLALTADNTYTGTTTVADGRLLVNGSVASSFTTVQSGGALGGSGIVNNINLNTGGAVTPGNSIGTLEGTSLTWDGEADDSFGQMQFELSNTDNTSDQLDLSGSFTKGSGSFFTFDFLGTGAADQTYTLVNFGSTDFVVDDFEYTGLASGLSGEFSLDGSSLQISVIPEPGTLTLLVISFGGLVIAMKRRRR